MLYKLLLDIIFFRGRTMLKTAIGKRIKELRIITKEYSQEQLAEQIGWDRTYISRVESGKQNITIENLNQICNALGVTLKQFFSSFDEKLENDDLKGE